MEPVCEPLATLEHDGAVILVTCFPFQIGTGFDMILRLDRPDWDGHHLSLLQEADGGHSIALYSRKGVDVDGVTYYYGSPRIRVRLGSTFGFGGLMFQITQLAEGGR